MKSKFNKFIMNPWTISVGSGLFVLLVTVVIDVVSADKIFSTIKKIMGTIWSAILAFLNFELKVWWLLIGIAMLMLGLYIWVKYLDQKQAVSNKPKFLEYTHDTILGYKWKWIWGKDTFGRYNIMQLHPICSHCDTPLVDSPMGYSGRYTCLRCNNSTNRPMPDLEHVKMMIRDNVRRRYFPND